MNEKAPSLAVLPVASKSTHDEPSQEAIISIPDDWAMPWSNSLLRQRIEEREMNPGCGGGLRRGKCHKYIDT